MNGPKTGRSGVRIVSGEELIRCCNKSAKKAQAEGQEVGGGARYTHTKLHMKEGCKVHSDSIRPVVSDEMTDGTT